MINCVIFFFNMTYKYDSINQSQQFILKIDQYFSVSTECGRDENEHAGTGTGATEWPIYWAGVLCLQLQKQNLTDVIQTAIIQLTMQFQ